MIKLYKIQKLFHDILYIDDPEKKSKFLRKHMESESEIRDMLKTPKYKTAADLVSKNHYLFNNLYR